MRAGNPIPLAGHAWEGMIALPIVNSLFGMSSIDAIDREAGTFLAIEIRL